MPVSATEEPQAETAAAGEAVVKPRKGPRGKVVIFGTWCKGCGLCVAFCPAGVLALDSESHPYVAKPEACTACHWCDTHCPDLAIVIKPVGN